MPKKITAQHIIFVFSLLRAVENKKDEYRNSTENETVLSDQDNKKNEFLRSNGSRFLIIYIISNIFEIITNRKIKNKFGICFKDSICFDDAITKWSPILDIVLGFNAQLLEPTKNSLKKQDAIVSAINTIKTLIDVVKINLRGVFDDFLKDLKFID